MCDGAGVPLAAEVTAGQAHESKQVESVLGKVRIPNRVGRPRCRPLVLAGDKGYSYPRVRAWLRKHKVKAVIPRRKDQRPDDGRVRFDKAAYRRRAVVE